MRIRHIILIFSVFTISIFAQTPSVLGKWKMEIFPNDTTKGILRWEFKQNDTLTAHSEVYYKNNGDWIFGGTASYLQPYQFNYPFYFMDGYPYFTIFKGDSLGITGIEDTNGMLLAGNDVTIFGTWALDSSISWEFTEKYLLFKIYSVHVDSFPAKYDANMVVLNDSTSLKTIYGYRILDSALQLFLLKCDISSGDSVCELESFQFVRDDSIGVEMAAGRFNNTYVLNVSPSPCQGSSVARISASGTAGGTLYIFAPDGRLIRTLPAAKTSAWDGRDEAGRLMAAGVYLVSWQDNGKVLSRKPLVYLR